MDGRLTGKLLAGRYELGSLMDDEKGNVYRAQDRNLDRKVAVKCLDNTFDASSLERFRREAELAARLRHPSTVRIFEQGETDGTLWIAMELLEGEPLHKRLKRKRVLTPRELANLFVPVCNAIEEAHANGIIHRDLKPQNIILAIRGGEETPVVFDFGIAGLVTEHSLTHVDFVAGTPAYMAPEQFRSLQHAGVASDIYSLGVIAYECLTGQRPYEARDWAEWYAKHRDEKPRSLLEVAGPDSKIPTVLARLIMKALSKQPEERLPSAGVFGDAIRAAVDGRELSPRRIPRAPLLALALGISVLGFELTRQRFSSAKVPMTPEAAPTVTATIAGVVVTAATQAETAAPTLRPATSRSTPAITPEGTGTLSVDSVPWGEIFVDGEPTGRDTPAFNLELAAGHHEIRIVNAPAHLEARFPVDVIAGGLLRRGTVTLVAPKPH